MEGETQPLPACVSKVLDDDNLLAEIIVRVGFPTSLVRAAAVCRRWLRIASDRAFLRRFRKFHPPRLLGFYLAHRWYPQAETFFPMLPQPPPPELAPVVRRASFSLDTYMGRQTDMVSCCNGRVVTRLGDVCHISNHSLVRKEIRFAVHNPLCSERGMTIIPAFHLEFQEGSTYSYNDLLLKEEGNILSCFFVVVEATMDETKSTLHVYMLKNGDDAWHPHLTLPVDYLICAQSKPIVVLVDNKIYMASSRNEIVVLDLATSSFSAIQLPQGVDCLARGTVLLSRADDASAVYLIYAKELQVHIWIHKGGNWLLLDKICLRETCARFLEDDPTALLQINHVGDYTGEFLFLEMGRYVLYLDVKCRTLRKVYEKTRENLYFGRIYPFLMIWPPIFPVIKDGPASNST